MDGVSEETAFLARLKEDSGDLGLRLVFADWLEEHGRVALAELFRVEVELARLPPFDGAVLLGSVELTVTAEGATVDGEVALWDVPPLKRGEVGQSAAVLRVRGQARRHGFMPA